MKDPYNNIANWYDSILEPLINGLRRIGLKMFSVNEDMNVLDIGCGTGAHLKLYQEKKCNLYGIDLSDSMINVAKRNLSKEVKLELCNATNTPFSNNFFDFIYSMLVLHEMDEDVRAGVLSEANRILKNDGRILLIDYHNRPIRNLKGFISKIIITIFEFAAGKKHYKNYRQFIKSGALPRLIKSQNFEIENQRILSGGTFGIFLLKKVNYKNQAL